MFDKTILLLQSCVEAHRDISNDHTGVITQDTKDQAAALVLEYEQAIAALGNNGVPKLLEFINWWRVNWKDSISHTALEELDLWIQRNCQA